MLLSLQSNDGQVTNPVSYPFTVFVVADVLENQL